MTVVPRRRPAPAPRRGARRKPLSARFPRGLRVQVAEDFGDPRYAGRFGTVVEVVETPEPPVYPFGRVALRLVEDELYAKLWPGQKPPSPVWFKPNMIERLHDDPA